MKLSGYTPRGSADGTIHFPILECWNPVTKCVSIAADVNGRRVLCRIPETVLKKRFDAHDGGPTAQVAANRRVIEAAASVLIQRKAFATDGMIDIRLEDFG
jgi:Protein of unknown function (DUF1488)